jgi:RAB protein geranylgeranyltransferase component A
MSLFDSMGFENRLKDILLYALGMMNNTEEVQSIVFFKRIAKYLRSIGYYGDSPFMMCNYGSSEYAQAFSRIGSLYGNVYIVNDDIDIQEIKSADNKVSSIEINYNNTPIAISKGIIAGHHYRTHFDVPPVISVS